MVCSGIHMLHTQYLAYFIKKNSDMKLLPRSVTNISLTPCLVTTCVAYALATVTAEMSFNGMASAYLVILSMTVSTYRFPALDLGRGPHKSIWTIWKARVGSKTLPIGALNSCFPSRL